MNQRGNDTALGMNRIKQERERRQRAMKKEDYLLKQIDEFREKAKQLQTLLDSREVKVQELQLLVDEKQVQANELEEVIINRQTEADQLITGVGQQMDQLIAQLQMTSPDGNRNCCRRSVRG